MRQQNNTYIQHKRTRKDERRRKAHSKPEHSKSADLRQGAHRIRIRSADADPDSRSLLLQELNGDFLI